MIQAEPGHWIEVTDLSPRLRKIEGTVTRIAPKQGTLKEMMEQVERWLITEALRDHGNNKTKTAVDARHHARGPAQEARQVRRVRRGAVTGRIFQLNRSPGGVPKLPVREVHVATLGLEGDGHAHPKVHGGPDRAVCLLSLELIQLLQAEGHPIYPGSTGENVTVSGLDWATLVPGARLLLGDDVILSSPATPTRAS